MKRLVKSIYVRWLQPIVLVVVGLLVLATVVGAAWMGERSAESSPAPEGDARSYTPPACRGSSEPTEAADAIVNANDANLYPAAKRLYKAVIANGTPADRACAASGLALLLEKEDAEASAAAARAGWREDLERNWSRWTKANVDPLEQALLAALGLLVLLLTIARLLTGQVVRPESLAPETWARRAWWWTGMLLVGAACLSPLVAAATTADDGWWPVVPAAATSVLVVALVPWRSMHWGRAVIPIGCAGLVVAVLAGSPLDVDLSLLAGAWAAVVGVVLVAFARGLNLAIEVQVHGSSGDDNATRARMMVARLQELGSHNPRDIRVLEASDVTSLPEDALTTVPTGAVATAVFNVIKLVRPAAPWRVTLSQPDEGTLVMDVARNRIAVPEGSIVVNVADLPKPPAAEAAQVAGKADESDEAEARDLDDLMTVAAAQTLLVLAEAHRTLKAGLCGANRWEALALHAVALRPATSAQRKDVLLHAAVDASPRYILPRMALVNQIDDSNAAGRLRYAEELERLWEEFKEELEPGGDLDQVRPGYAAAQLRMLYNRAVAWMNVRTDRAIAPQLGPANEAWTTSATAALALRTRIDRLREDRARSLDDLAEESDRPVGFMLLDLSGHAPDGDVPLKAEVNLLAGKLDPEGPALRPQTRNDFYGRACYYAAFPADEEKWRSALIDLRVAATAPRFAEWAPKDPSMAVFTLSNARGKRANDELVKEFKELVTAPALTSYLELPIFKGHAEALESYGMTSLGDVRAVPAGTLARTVKVHASVADRWVKAAQLDDFLRQLGEPDEDARLQLLELLLSMDITSRLHLNARLGGDRAALEKFYAAMVKQAATKRIVPTWEETIKRWTGLERRKDLVVR